MRQLSPHARTRATSRLGAEPHSPVLFTCQTAHVSSFPRRVFCARVLPFASRTRSEGWAERRKNVGCLRGTRSACFGHARRWRGASRPSARDARLSALHRGDFGPGVPLSLTGLASGSVSDPSHTRGVAPATSGYKPPPRDATPRFAFRIVSRRHPSGARMRIHIFQLHFAVKHEMN